MWALNYSENTIQYGKAKKGRHYRGMRYNERVQQSIYESIMVGGKMWIHPTPLKSSSSDSVSTTLFAPMN